MSVLVYTKDNCPFCVKAKALLTQKNRSFMEVKIGTDMLREDFIQMFPDQRTVPLIFVDGVKIGGYNELVEYFGNTGPELLTE